MMAITNNMSTRLAEDTVYRGQPFNELYLLSFSLIRSLILMINTREVRHDNGHWRGRDVVSGFSGFDWPVWSLKSLLNSPKLRVSGSQPANLPGRAMTNTPDREQTPPTIFPTIVLGTMSP